MHRKTKHTANQNGHTASTQSENPLAQMAIPKASNAAKHTEEICSRTCPSHAKRFRWPTVGPVCFRLNLQVNKLNLPTNYVARLQHCTAICAIASMTVTPTILALWLKNRMGGTAEYALHEVGGLPAAYARA